MIKNCLKVPAKQDIAHTLTLEAILAGPNRAEPFNESLNKMDDDLALRVTFDAMKKSFELLKNTNLNF